MQLRNNYTVEMNIYHRRMNTKFAVKRITMAALLMRGLETKRMLNTANKVQKEVQ